MIKIKKISMKTKYLIATIVLAVVVIGGGALLFNYIYGQNNNQTIAVSDKPAADKLKAKAIDYLSEGNTKHAKQMFETAKKQYEYLVERSPDQEVRDAAQNEVIDCEAQIWLIDHS